MAASAPKLDFLAKWLIIAGRQVSQQLGEKLARLDLTASNYYYILKIHDRPGVTQKDLIESEFLNPSNVTRALKQLMVQKLVVRRQHPEDKRAYQLALTPKGAALYPQINAILQEEERLLETTVQKQVPEFEVERFVQVLQVLSSVLHPAVNNGGKTDEDHHR